MNFELKDIKTKAQNANVSRKILAGFIKEKEKKENEEWKEIYKKLFCYGILFFAVVLLGFLIGWFSSLFHHSDSETSEEQAKKVETDTGLQCQVEGSIEKGHDCVHIFTCKQGFLVESVCPKFHQFDSVSKTCKWIHLAKCQDTDEDSAVPIDDAGDVADEHPTPSLAGVPTLQQVHDTEVRLVMKHGLQRVRRSLSTLPNEEVEKIAPNRKENPSNVAIVESLISSREWNMLFPMRNPVYTYRSFLQAVGKFPSFCETDKMCAKSLAVIFAHFTQETGAHDTSAGYPQWRQGLFYLEESGCQDRDCGYSSNCGQDTWLTETWPCQRNTNGRYNHYHGRGAKQISYNYNYGQFSTFMFDNATVLLKDPDRIANSWLALASAIWFFLMPQPPKPSMLEVLDGSWKPNSEDEKTGLDPGFGLTTNIINGGVECGKGYELQQSLNRQEYFRRFYSELKIEDRRLLQNLGCSEMKEFPSSGAGSQSLFWEQDWSRRYYCKLVSYATPYSALVKGDYQRCVEKKFKVKLKQ